MFIMHVSILVTAKSTMTQFLSPWLNPWYGNAVNITFGWFLFHGGKQQWCCMQFLQMDNVDVFDLRPFCWVLPIKRLVIIKYFKNRVYNLSFRFDKWIVDWVSIFRHLVAPIWKSLRKIIKLTFWEGGLKPMVDQLTIVLIVEEWSTPWPIVFISSG